MNPKTHHGTAAKVVGAVSLAALSLLTPHVADAQNPKSAQAAVNNKGNIVDGLEFRQTSATGVYMVYDVNKPSPVGAVMDVPGMPLTVNALAEGYQSRLERAYNNFAAGKGQAAPTGETVTVANTNAPNQNPGGGGVATTSPASGWDEASKSVTMPDGATVTFQGNGDDIKVANFHGQSFTLHHKGASPGGFFRSSVIDPQRGKVGGSIGGGGVEITQDGSGRKVYDSSQGTAYRGTLTLAKAVAAEVSDAIEAASQAGHPNIAPNIAKDLPGILQL